MNPVCGTKRTFLHVRSAFRGNSGHEKIVTWLGPPYDLPVAQTASSRPQGEIVEVILIVSAPNIQPETVEVRVPMSRETTQALGAQLNLLSPAAE